MKLRYWLIVIVIVLLSCAGFIYYQVDNDASHREPSLPERARQQNLKNKDKKPFKEFGKKMENRVKDAKPNGETLKSPEELKKLKKKKKAHP